MNRGLLDDFKNAWGKPNNAVAQIILINVILFVVLLLLDIILPAQIFSAIYKHFVIPPTFDELIFRPYTIITYSFTHSLYGIGHIFFNMLAFFYFGRIIAEYLGSNKVISIYILGAIFGAIPYLLAYNFVPELNEKAVLELVKNPSWGMVGASAGVYAIVVAAAVKLPNYTFFLMFLGPVKLKHIAMFFIVISLIGINANANIGGNVAHIGGALLGWLYITQLNKGIDLGGWIISFMDFIKSMFKPQPKIKVTHRGGNRSASKKASSPNSSSSSGSQTPQSEIDEILDKISEKGYESLSKDEKQKLFNASKK